METPKKPLKKSADTEAGVKKTTNKADAPKSKRFVDDDDDDEFDNSLDELDYDALEGIEEEDDY